MLKEADPLLELDDPTVLVVAVEASRGTPAPEEEDSALARVMGFCPFF